MYRYITFVWNPNKPEGHGITRSLAAGIERASDWALAYDGPGILAFHTGADSRTGQAYPLKRHGGAVLGKLFHHDGSGQTAGRPVALDERNSQRIVESGGRHLIDAYWGRYVAVVYDENKNSHTFLRDPSGGLTCFQTSYRDVEVFFSSINDCVRLVPLKFSLNRQYAVASLVSRMLLIEECGLNEVKELAAGQRMQITDGPKAHEQLWSAVDILSTDRIENTEEAGAALRASVHQAVDAWASCYDNIVMSLSGGLDSSIVTACLSHSPAQPTITTFNYYSTVTKDDEKVDVPFKNKAFAKRVAPILGHADERKFARLVADRYGLSMVEGARPLLHWDVDTLLDVPLSLRVPLFPLYADIDRMKIDVVQSTGANALFTGIGGDVVFDFVVEAWPAVDYVRWHGLGPRFFQVVREAALASRESVWSVLGRAFRNGLLRQQDKQYWDPMTRKSLIKPDALDMVSRDYIESPWIRSHRNLPPAKRRQVSGLAAGTIVSQMVHKVEYHADLVHPLSSQPVMETALRIPSYVLMAGGKSRGLARRAFSDLLPPEVRRRQVKGHGDPYAQRVAKTNLGFVREFLLDGLAVKEGFLDRRGLEDYLVEDQSYKEIMAVEILDYVCVEAWLRNWSSVLRHKAAA